MFSFDEVRELIVSSSSQGWQQQQEQHNQGGGDKQEMTRVLMVAEKPSIAKAIADALSGPRGPRQRRGISRALPVYEFTSNRFKPYDQDANINDDATAITQRCLVTVTSVVGHIFSLGFEYGNDQNEDTNDKDSSLQQGEHQQSRRRIMDPSEYFKLPVVKQEETSTGKLRVVDHLRALAAGCDHLVLWLDCDAEGENIAYEVIGVTRRALEQRALAKDRPKPTVDNDGDSECSSTTTNTTSARRVHRARFSSITKKAIQDAFDNLSEPDPALSRSVDARQELDLRVGVALTRLLTWRCVGSARKRFSPSTRMVSYGPCQTPALSFCVDRAKEIEKFQSKDYWRVHVTAAVTPAVDGSSKKDTILLKWNVHEINSHAHNDKDNMNNNEIEEQSYVPGEDSSTFDKHTAEHVVKLASNPGASAVV
eukprot:1687713-Ditylum_brightwellii.AAC.1